VLAEQLAQSPRDNLCAALMSTSVVPASRHLIIAMHGVSAIPPSDRYRMLAAQRHVLCALPARGGAATPVRAGLGETNRNSTNLHTAACHNVEYERGAWRAGPVRPQMANDEHRLCQQYSPPKAEYHSSGKRGVPMTTILLVLLILLLLGALPAWPYSRGWGYYPSGGLGLILLILLILLLAGRI
jgi:hypothetical protein